MSPDSVLEHPVPCSRCRYNLLTLGLTARCPECGFPVLRSYVQAQVRNRRGVVDPVAAYHDEAVRLVSRMLRRNVDSIRFILWAYHQGVRQQRTGLLSFRPKSLSARQLCDAIVEHALIHFRDEGDARGTLKFWRIERSDDVGEIFASLAEAGLVEAGKEDSPADFVGLCALDELFELHPGREES